MQGQKKNVAVFPCATDEQIFLVKTTRVSVHASPSKVRRGEKKANVEREKRFGIVVKM